MYIGIYVRSRVYVEGGGDCAYIRLHYEVRGYRRRTIECVMNGELNIYIYIYI